MATAIERLEADREAVLGRGVPVTGAAGWPGCYRQSGGFGSALC
jgi:hypothetical protein